MKTLGGVDKRLKNSGKVEDTEYYQRIVDQIKKGKNSRGIIYAKDRSKDDYRHWCRSNCVDEKEMAKSTRSKSKFVPKIIYNPFDRTVKKERAELSQKT